MKNQYIEPIISILNVNAEVSQISEEPEIDELEDVNTVKNAELNPLISEVSEEYETLIIHAHAPYSEENTSENKGTAHLN